MAWAIGRYIFKRRGVSLLAIILVAFAANGEGGVASGRTCCAARGAAAHVGAAVAGARRAAREKAAAARCWLCGFGGEGVSLGSVLLHAVASPYMVVESREFLLDFVLSSFQSGIRAGCFGQKSVLKIHHFIDVARIAVHREIVVGGNGGGIV